MQAFIQTHAAPHHSLGSTQEAEEIPVINSFLPQQLSGSEVEAAIAETGASSVKDMGKVRCAEGAICGADGFCDCQRAREGDPWRVRVRDCL
jgi:uncharacterized protein YqeY